MAIDIDALTIGDIKQLQKLLGNGCDQAEQQSSPMVGKHCLVRTYSAGVHIGTVESQTGKQVILKNSRRLWKWGGAFTLSEVAATGVDPSKSRMSVTTPVLVLTEAIEIIPVTASAAATFEVCHAQ